MMGNMLMENGGVSVKAALGIVPLALISGAEF
jgi:hypothetical protein